MELLGGGADGRGRDGHLVHLDGVTFPWPAHGSALDNFIPSGQTIAVSTTQKGGKLALLGSASAGPSTGTGTLTYGDGTSKPFTIGFSDWTLGGGNAQVMPGTQIALTTAYRNRTAGGKDRSRPTSSTRRCRSTRQDAVVSDSPPTVSAGRMHIFSLALAP